MWGCKRSSSRKCSYLPCGRSSEIPSGKGVLKVKNLEAKLEILGETEVAIQKTFHRGGGGVGYFLELHKSLCNTYSSILLITCFWRVLREVSYRQ